ncbi:MAG: TlpA disulfide reductase family protein [Steroidobacteraceae bacterium]|nr:TlpA disulfide reductase family protein [Steroidobacteraceae bacterium]
MDVVALGPLTLAADRLVAIAAAWLYLSVSEVAARRTGLPLGRASWAALLVGLIVARATYVVGHWPAFATEPWWAPLQFWHGGLAPAAGFVGAAVAASVVVLLGTANGAAKAQGEPASRGTPRAGGAVGLALAVLAVPAMAWFAAERFWFAPPPAQPLPDATVAWLDGRPVRLSEFRGRPLVVNVWASWCGPCRREMPMLARAARERPDATFVFLNTGEDPATVRRYLTEERLRLPVVLLDVDGSAGRALGAIGLPTTYFVSADGALVRTHVGQIGRSAVEAGLRRAAGEE